MKGKKICVRVIFSVFTEGGRGMTTLREQYGAMSVDELEKLLAEASLTTANKNLCKAIINEKLGTKKYAVDSVEVSERLADTAPGVNISVPTQYKITRIILAVAAILGWIAFVGGVIFLLFALSNLFSKNGMATVFLLSVMGPGLGLTMSGLLLIMFSQLTRAGLDSADYARETLAITKLQLSRRNASVAELG